MKAFFRARILKGLKHLLECRVISQPEHAELLATLPPEKKWVVYLEAPFSSSTHIVKYLGRYTHRVAISDARLVSADAQQVCFITRDGKIANLLPTVFTERFMLHILPSGFHKIRHYGLYAPGASRARLDTARKFLAPPPDSATDANPTSNPSSREREPWDKLILRLTGKDPLLCPKCRGARLQAHYLSSIPFATGPPLRNS
jgi:hypothetical protein